MLLLVRLRSRSGVGMVEARVMEGGQWERDEGGLAAKADKDCFEFGTPRKAGEVNPNLRQAQPPHSLVNTRGHRDKPINMDMRHVGNRFKLLRNPYSRHGQLSAFRPGTFVT